MNLVESDGGTDTVTINAGTNVTVDHSGSTGYYNSTASGGTTLWSRSGTVLSPNTCPDVRLTDGGQLQFIGDTEGQFDIRTDAETGGTYALILPDDTPAAGEVLTVETGNWF